MTRRVISTTELKMRVVNTGPPRSIFMLAIVACACLTGFYFSTYSNWFDMDMDTTHFEHLEETIHRKWVPSDRCVTHMYTEEELDEFQGGYNSSPLSRRCKNATDVLNGKCEKLLHSCNPSEVELNDGTMRPYGLEWDGLSEGAVEKLWKHLYDTKLSNMKLYLVGDSMMYQVFAALLLMLTRMGIHCEGYPMRSMKCSNGLVIVRPFVGQLTDLEAVKTYILNSNITIFNSGLHYGTLKCSEDGNQYCKDLVTALKELDGLSQANNVKLVWLDTFRPHFPAIGGHYENFSQKEKRDRQCGPLDEQDDDSSYIFFKFIDQLLETEHKTLPQIRIRDIVRDRWDNHNGLLTWYSAEKLDCVHHCMQPCFWEPILYRVGHVIGSLLKDDDIRTMLAN